MIFTPGPDFLFTALNAEDVKSHSKNYVEILLGWGIRIYTVSRNIVPQISKLEGWIRKPDFAFYTFIKENENFKCKVENNAAIILENYLVQKDWKMLIEIPNVDGRKRPYLIII